MFDHTIPPAFLNLDGSSIHDTEKPTLPGSFSVMSKDEKPVVVGLSFDQALAFVLTVLLREHIQPVSKY